MPAARKCDLSGGVAALPKERLRDRPAHLSWPGGAGICRSGASGAASSPSKENAMPVYKAPVEDALFLLNDVFHIERFANLPGFADASPDVVEAMLGTAARFCEEVLTPLNRVGDEEGCRRGYDGSVVTPAGFKEAYRQCVEGGWIRI